MSDFDEPRKFEPKIVQPADEDEIAGADDPVAEFTDFDEDDPLNPRIDQ
jgi:hypothetical protein